ncbi:MAG TPA: SAM-dependent chlorinase/fluorinase [Candidatus Limnocylindria bacterium]|nr:SAM-dependent chlorinase/fluorinase [Candidatus Limnocylindrales bacterium]
MQSSPPRPVMGFLTDFGLDGAAATCRAVMLSICRDAQIVDIAHTIRKYAIRDGAFLLRFALPYFPVGVHVGVVDPGVGTERRAIGVRTGRGDILIGPDNGLLLPPAEALGGIEDARELTNRDLWLPVATSTFHGRDIFSPVAAHLAAGDATFEEVGATLEPNDLVAVPEPAATVRPGMLETVITYVDSFGNARLAGERDDLAASLGGLRDGLAVTVTIDAGGSTLREDTQFVSTFGAVPVGTSLLYIDSLGNLALADNQGNLARRLGIEPDLRVTIRPRA